MTNANGFTNGHAHVNGHSKSNGSAKLSSKECMELEEKYSAHNYHPLPIVFASGKGAVVTDPEGREFIDCLSAYSAVNQGHCHPKIVAALVEQAQKLTLASRAFHSDNLGAYAKKVTELLGFDMVLPMNTGAEAVETSLKLARKWAYKVKGVQQDKAIILSVTENFHGRTLAVVSMSTDPVATKEFGPFIKSVGPKCPAGKGEIRYNNVDDLERALEAHGKDTAAFLVEPIQGEAGIIVPDDDYLERVQTLCRKHNVLLIVDEIQTGLGRTGKMLCHQHNPNVKPDIVTLGKALSGGVYPVAAVLARRDVMLTIQPGEHGSTYGGNPLGCAVAMAALDVLVDEKMCERAEELGAEFAANLKTLGVTTRCKGLMAAIEVDNAWDVCVEMSRRGVLAKPTHDRTIRLAPPLVITREQLQKVVEVIRECLGVEKKTNWVASL